MLLKNPLFDTLRDKMDVLEQDHENTSSRNINAATEFETDGQNKCYITPDTDLGVWFKWASKYVNSLETLVCV